MTDHQTKRNLAANLKRLLAVRPDRESSQAWLAESCGESEMRISLYVRGIKMASAGVLMRMAEALGVTTDELLSTPPKSRRKQPA